VLKGSICLLI